MTREERLAEVKRMDEIILNDINDEELIMDWLTLGCPDCSTEEDYEWFADDEEEFNSLVKLFESILYADNEG